MTRRPDPETVTGFEELDLRALAKLPAKTARDVLKLAEADIAARHAAVRRHQTTLRLRLAAAVLLALATLGATVVSADTDHPGPSAALRAVHVAGPLVSLTPPGWLATRR